MLDVFLVDKPERASNIKNVVNILSEHEGVFMLYEVKVQLRCNQFIKTQKYRNFTWENVEKDVLENDDLQTSFQDPDPDKIAENS